MQIRSLYIEYIFLINWNYLSNNGKVNQLKYFTKYPKYITSWLIVTLNFQTAIYTQKKRKNDQLGRTTLLYKREIKKNHLNSNDKKKSGVLSTLCASIEYEKEKDIYDTAIGKLSVQYRTCVSFRGIKWPTAYIYTIESNERERWC